MKLSMNRCLVERAAPRRVAPRATAQCVRKIERGFSMNGYRISLASWGALAAPPPSVGGPMGFEPRLSFEGPATAQSGVAVHLPPHSRTQARVHIQFSSVWLAIILTFAISIQNAAAQDTPTTLKDAFKDDFRIGAAINQSQFEGNSPREAQIIETQFNTISPENVLKWEAVHPAPGRFNFQDADQYVAFGQKNRMFIIGHNLIWHNQTPAWVFQDADGNPISRDALIARMRDHIMKVVGRYKGKIGGWDVVNEALNEDGTLRNSSWRRIIGDDYLVLAYQFAHEADPNAQLYYNDYSLENLPKRQGAIALIKRLQSRGVRIDAIGLQEHDKMDWPSTNQVDETISAFSQLGIKVMITEMDVDLLPAATRSHSAEASMSIAGSSDLNPYANGLPDALQQKLAQRYADLFSVFVAHHGQISRVTFWGVTDADSWLNNWPVPGRTSYPLLFDRNCNPKPAFAAVIHIATPIN